MFAADVLWQRLLTRLDARGFGDRQLMIEPGRSLVGNAGVCITEILYLKPGEGKNFCIVDAAMNDLVRPAMYEAWMGIMPCTLRDEAPRTYDVVGPVCESGDWLGRERALAVREGDRIAVLSAGAYGMVMASNYNTRPLAPELLLERGAVRQIRRRQTIAELLALEE